MSKRNDDSTRWIRRARNQIAKETAGMTLEEKIAYSRKNLDYCGYREVPNGDGTFLIQPKEAVQGAHPCPSDMPLTL